MNVYDSEKILDILYTKNYRKTDQIEDADLIITNTCSVRVKAEEKAFSFLGRLPGLKKKNKDLIIGICGCVAQQEGKKILKRVPYVDIVFGTRAIGRLPELIEKTINEKVKVVDVEMTDALVEFDQAGNTTQEQSEISKFVTIMRGCDNFCTYCVVPYVRGREVSRHPDNIVTEITGLVENGVREVTLLGQNVNSYGSKEGLCSFPQLLEKVNDIDGLKRIRFATSHPKDLSDDLIDAYAKLDKLCKHIHLPVQSGSDLILKKMNRKYTVEDYIYKVNKLRTVCEGVALTSDIIVGFPGERQEDFEETLSLMNKIQFDSLFAFKYSDRPNAPSTAFSSKVSESEKKGRLKELLDFQEKITNSRNKAYLGKTEKILVEGYSKRAGKNKSENEMDEIQWTGRTSTGKIVNFINRKNMLQYNNDLIAKLVNVKIKKALSHSLWGELVL